MTVSQLTLLCAVQLQPAVALTVTQFDPPNDEIVALVGLIDAPQVEEPAWVIVNVCPATVMAALRDAVVAFAAAVKVIVALPDPLVVPVRLTQPAVLVALHAQPAGAVTVNELAPPLAVAA